MITIEQMIQREVQCCVSALVSTLANGSGCIDARSRNAPRDDAAKALADLAEQAFELSSPIDDFEEAAIQAGWRSTGPLEFTHSGGRVEAGDSWETLCNDEEIEPYQSEVYEHWAVSTWLAEQLTAQGEKVDTDFGNLNVWARQTTGQQISADGVIERIYTAMMKA